MRSLIATFKVFLLIVIYLITIPLQALNRVLLNNTRLFFIVPYLFHGSLRRVFGIKVRLQGTVEKDKQVVYVSNHLSYLDIPLLGSFLPAHFVSKDDVQSWPILGLLATLAKTIFISRTPSKALKSIEQMKEAGARRAMPLPVSIPAHSSLMSSASARLADRIASVEISSLLDCKSTQYRPATFYFLQRLLCYLPHFQR